MSYITELREKRETYGSTAKAILTRAETEKREMTATEAKDFQGLRAKIDAISETLKAVEGLDESRAANLIGNVPSSTTPPRSTRTRPREAGEPITLRSNERLADYTTERLPDNANVSDFSIGKLLRAHVSGDWKRADFELRAIGGSSGSGAYVLPSPVASHFIDLSRASTQALRAGVKTIAFSDSKLVIPRLSGDVTASWRAEHSAIDESDPTIDGVSVTAKSLASMVRVSIELLQDSPQLAGEMLTASLMGAMGVEIDRAILRGDGTGSIPKGILHAAGVATGGIGSTAVVWEDVSLAAAAVQAYNFEPSGIIWAPAVAAKLDRSKDSVYHWLPSSPDVAPIPRYASNQIPTNLGTGTNESEIYVAQWDQAALLLRQGIALEISREAGDAFSKNQVLIRATMRADVGVFHPKAFFVLTGVK